MFLKHITLYIFKIEQPAGHADSHLVVRNDGRITRYMELAKHVFCAAGQTGGN